MDRKEASQVALSVAKDLITCGYTGVCITDTLLNLEFKFTVFYNENITKYSTDRVIAFAHGLEIGPKCSIAIVYECDASELLSL